MNPKHIISLWTLHFVALIFLSAIFTNGVHAQDIDKSMKAPPVSVTGNLDLHGILYSVKGIPARRKPFSYILTGNAVVSLYGIEIPVSATVSEQERSIKQPFNQFGLSPKYKWITAHLGYRSVNFSPYTLAGYNMLGAGAELNPGKFHLGFMYGRLNRATSLDTTTGVIRPYSFSRKGYALKIGFGTEHKLFELSFLSAKDDSSSFNNKNIADTFKTVKPAANTVVGARFRYTLFKKLVIEADGAASVYTNDINSKLFVDDDIKKINNSAGSIIPVNATTQVNAAYTASLAYTGRNYSIKLAYRHIDPEFQSMGAYYFNNDIESYTLSPAFSAFKGRLRFNGSIGLQKDNLRKQKQATTRRIIGSANISCDLTPQLGIDANYINYSANAKPEVLMVNNKYLLAQANHNLSVNPRYIHVAENTTHAVLLSYNYSTVVDLNKETSDFNNINTNVWFLNYNLTFNKTGLTLTCGVNEAVNKFYYGTVKNYGFTIGAAKNLLKNKLQLGTSNSLSRSDQYGGASVLNAGVNASYNLQKHHRFSFRWLILRNSPDEPLGFNKAFTEQTSELNYTWSF